MRFALATCAFALMTSAGFAAEKDRPLNDMSDPSWGFSKVEVMQALVTQQAIMNTYCVAMTGKSVVGTPGFATYALPRLLFAAPHNLSNERAIEIYDQIFDQTISSAGDFLSMSKQEWDKVCNDYRARVSPSIMDLIKRVDKK